MYRDFVDDSDSIDCGLGLMSYFVHNFPFFALHIWITILKFWIKFKISRFDSDKRQCASLGVVGEVYQIHSTRKLDGQHQRRIEVAIPADHLQVEAFVSNFDSLNGLYKQ